MPGQQQLKFSSWVSLPLEIKTGWHPQNHHRDGFDQAIIHFKPTPYPAKKLAIIKKTSVGSKPHERKTVAYEPITLAGRVSKNAQAISCF
jgi:hypothetical protein